jgi:hypothetical protein
LPWQWNGIFFDIICFQRSFWSIWSFWEIKILSVIGHFVLWNRHWICKFQWIEKKIRAQLVKMFRL